MNRLTASLLVLIPALALADGKLMKAATEGKDLWATFNTSEGNFTVKLFAKDAPKTVTNFVGLATGEKEWKGNKDKPLYNGVVFHRVIPNFMIQGGDPEGTGRGDPGYRFEDEFTTPRATTFDKVGLLAMANAGPNTNGSQFFVTTSVPTYLNRKHTIFGEVVSGYDIVEKISKVPTQPGDRPVKPVVISKIEITEKAPAGVAAKPAAKAAPAEKAAPAPKQ